MNRLLSLAAVLLWVGAALANPEMTVDLPGGATMDFVWIEPGTFMMGSPDSEFWADDEEKPQHDVILTRGFWLGRCEVTQGQWQAAVGTAPWSGQDWAQANPNHPAVYITWDDVQGMVSRLNQAEGQVVYRLPTEAEWEYACRAGTTTQWSFGEDERRLVEYAWYAADQTTRWYEGDLQYAQSVGQKLPNQWGLYDMYGNVYEWVQDWWDHGGYPSGVQIDPVGLSGGSYRVIRGGAFNCYHFQLRSGERYASAPDECYFWIGARLVRMGPAPTPVEFQSWGQIKTEAR